MPRTAMDIPCRIDHLSILNEDGEVDHNLEPALPDDLLMRIHRTMLLCRRFDERMLILQRQGRIGTFAPIKGQEAQIGAVVPLEPDDWIAPSFREMPAEVWRGKSLESVLLTYAGYNEGGRTPENINNLPIAIPVGSQTLHAVGIAYAMKYRHKSTVAMTFFGDGATSQGDFHEALNFAATFQVPAIFVCQNNQWAISFPRSKQTRSRTLAQKAVAYEMPGIQVDGNDVLAVYVAAREAVDRARGGEGPTLIEDVTYRMSVHTTADDPKKYRRDEEVEPWMRRDPIIRFQKYLAKKGLLVEEEIQSVDKEVTEEVRKAEEQWARGVEKGIDPLDMFDHAYAELTPYVELQRDELRRELEERKREGRQAGENLR